MVPLAGQSLRGGAGDDAGPLWTSREGSPPLWPGSSVRNRNIHQLNWSSYQRTTNIMPFFKGTMGIQEIPDIRLTLDSEKTWMESSFRTRTIKHTEKQVLLSKSVWLLQKDALPHQPYAVFLRMSTSMSTGMIRQTLYTWASQMLSTMSITRGS